MATWAERGIQLTEGARRARKAGDDKAALELAFAAARCFTIHRALKLATTEER